MTTNRFILFCATVLCIVLASCFGETSNNETVQKVKETPAPTVKRSPVFSLFCNTSHDGYVLYNNSERISNFAIDESRKVLGMNAYQGNCYLLISDGKGKDGNFPAEIFKNGHPAMTFDTSFHAKSFVLDEGHFCVMGIQGDTIVSVFRDGSRIFSTKYNPQSIPKFMRIYKNDIYIAYENNGIDIMRNEEKIAHFSGKCRSFEVSHMGFYTLAGDTLYRDKEKIMSREYFRYSDKEMFSIPCSLTLTDQNCYVGCKTTIDDSKYYSAVFRNLELFILTKPDTKHIGDSNLQTCCAGVAASGENVYSVSYRLDEDDNMIQPVVYQYYYNKDECFRLEFSSKSPKLLFIASEK